MPGKSLTFNGVTLSLDAWAKRLGVAPATLYSRMWRGYPVEKVLARPKRKPPRDVKPRSSQPLTLNGITLPLDAWTKRLGVAVGTLYARMSRGVPVEEVLAPRRRQVRAPDRPGCAEPGCKRLAQSSTMPFCNPHIIERRSRPGPKCPRCRVFPPGANGELCGNCLRVIERRRTKPAAVGKCPHPGCWRRALTSGLLQDSPRRRADRKA
jgi:hypothetical protein